MSFFSKKFNSYQRHYSTVEKEALALIWALQHFSVYLNSSAPIVIYTDHNPLTFLILYSRSHQVRSWRAGVPADFSSNPNQTHLKQGKVVGNGKVRPVQAKVQARNSRYTLEMMEETERRREQSCSVRR